jgi:septum site-determining protein MinC
MATVLAPEPPVELWLSELDQWLSRSPGFFAGRPVILNLAALNIDTDSLKSLIGELSARGIRIVAVEGADETGLGLGLPPALTSGRDVETASPSPSQPPAKALPSLVIETPVRSGQSIIYPQGDVTIIGSVSSGAEVMAGGSIHVYGALRGRAIAGSMGNARASIFCRKFEAELIAIDGLYRTADDMDPTLRGKSVRVHLAGDAIALTALD